MKAPFLLAASLLLVFPPAWAADMPGANPSVPAPSVQDRLDKARKAVGSRDWSGAQRELNVAVRESPQNADVHKLLGYTYRKRASPDMAKAYEHYQTALKINPQHRGAHEYIGEAYLIDKRLPTRSATWPNWSGSAAARPARSTGTWRSRSRITRRRTELPSSSPRRRGPRAPWVPACAGMTAEKPGFPPARE